MAPVGVLALQGGFARHLAVVARLGLTPRPVRDRADLEGLGALILPGGESTVQAKLAGRRGLLAPLAAAVAGGLPTLGTCAGAILLARDLEARGPVDPAQPRLATLDATVLRNAYGPQTESFEARVLGPADLGPVPAVFIRAPRFTRWGPDVEVLALYQGSPVLLRQGHQVAATFHPELTDDDRVHRWFLSQVAGLR